jgi:hypothetical protein
MKKILLSIMLLIAFAPYIYSKGDNPGVLQSPPEKLYIPFVFPELASSSIEISSIADIVALWTLAMEQSSLDIERDFIVSISTGSYSGLMQNMFGDLRPITASAMFDNENQTTALQISIPYWSHDYEQDGIFGKITEVKERRGESPCSLYATLISGKSDPYKTGYVFNITSVDGPFRAGFLGIGHRVEKLVFVINTLDSLVLFPFPFINEQSRRIENCFLLSINGLFKPVKLGYICKDPF